MFETRSEASCRWMKLALKVETSKGNGRPMEMRSSAFGGRAFSHNDPGGAPTVTVGLMKASPPSAACVSAKTPACNRAVADARSS